MFGLKTPRRRGGKEEGEKPFWISFSDLMTALMVLFLVAMAVAVMAVTVKGEREGDKPIAACLAEVKKLETDFPGMKVSDRTINFGVLITFEHAMHSFEKKEQHAALIRNTVKKVLDIARDQQCESWLKKVVVEGFASTAGGTYLDNLKLSYLRSHRVLCTLLDSQAPDALSEADRKLIQSLFLTSASSFNTDKTRGEDQMRRVEVKLDFYPPETHIENRKRPPELPLDPGHGCP